MSAPAAKKAKSALEHTAKDGSFVRSVSSFRESIAQGGRFPPAAGRYHLYVSLACPWACRCVAAMYMKGLEDAIGLSVVHPTWQRTRPDLDEHCGWAFSDPSDAPRTSSTGFGSFDCRDCIPDPINGAKFVRDLYEKAGGVDYDGVFSVPILWDKEEVTIVNNESSEIMRMFNSEFNDFAKNPGLDLYPEGLRKDIDAAAEWVYPTINNGVYRCGFAQSQQAYDLAFDELFSSLDRLEGILEKQRYLAGDVLTEADIRLFATLIRFDEVYVVYFKTNKKALREYPNICNYVREVHQTAGVKESVNMYHIKTHYFTSHPKLNHYAVVPKGGDPWWEQPHDRAAKFQQ